MANQKKEKIIKVDNLIIHAKNVQIIQEEEEKEIPRRNPWGIFWGREQREEIFVERREDE